MTSTPAAKSWSAILGVMPSPPATFSPLTTTKSGSSRSRSAGSIPRSVRLPSPPTRSPANRMLMARDIQGLTPPTLIITSMRPWARPRTPDPPEPEGEPDPEAVEAGGPVGGEAASDDRETAGHAAGAGESESEPQALSSATPVVVPRWIQLVGLPLAILGLWALARASGSVLLILVVAGVVALILAPIVRLLERVFPRGLAILIVYFGGF